jgi:hypothetical protein
MLIPLLFAAIQIAPASNAATSPPPVANPEPPAIDITAGMRAYAEWRMCIDAARGAGPDQRSPRRRADAAIASCAVHEEALSTATLAAFGPAAGADLMARFRRDTRAQIGASPPR